MSLPLPLMHAAGRLAGLGALAALCAAPALTAETPRTLRLDYLHVGNAREERFALERVVVEPLPWPGAPEKALDDTNLGKYRFEVIDRDTRRPLYSRGFASVYGEWELTGEATTTERGFGESLRFPRPERPVQVVIQKRDRANDFREVWSVVVDPADPQVDASPPPAAGALLRLQESGAPADKVDFLILGDGYTAAERGKCEADARRLMAILFEVEPFRSRRADFNVWGLCPEAVESGVSRPSLGIHRRTPAGATYDAFGVERYVLTFDNRAFRDLASQAPYEFVEILVNGRTYGGGGIFGQYGTVAADSLWAPYIFVHEFGHHFAGARRRVLHLRDGQCEHRRADRALGAQRHGARRPGAAQVARPGGARHAAADAVGQGGLRDGARARSRPSAGGSAPSAGRRRRWTDSSRPSARRRSGGSAPRSTRARSAPSRAPTTRRRATSARRPTASCSPATASPSAPSAAAPSPASSICTR